MAIEIRTITAELLRPGPRHNHLLSPLTRYLGVCGDEEAGIVTVGYEHAEFLEQLNVLRYAVTDEAEPGHRRNVLGRLGTAIAKILKQIPGLGGSLKRELSGSYTLTHLRLVLSASELALLPWEAAKVPTGAGSPENWLSLRSSAPVCITRKIRSVMSEGVEWPQEPKILYVSGENVPFEEHKRALQAAIEPWVTPTKPESYWLTILEDASREEIRKACRSTRYTHVHILAHGAEDETRTGQPFGVLLADAVLSGSDLAADLTRVAPDCVLMPTVVTLATCDSAQQRQVYTPDASVAHELHDKGIPLVVASQFPLSVAGSIPFVRTFYTDQMWGKHPLLTLYRARLDLHGEQDVHDWASLVVYEALPEDLEEQLEHLRYWQARRANNAALDRLEKTVDDSGLPTEEQFGSVDSTIERFPDKGPYQTESVGLQASAHKRLAELHFSLSRRAEETDREKHLSECHSRLRSALDQYEKAVDAFLVNQQEPLHRKATLHWVGIQVLSMRAVLGEPPKEDLRMASRLAAAADLDHIVEPGNRAWAHGSHCELALLGLADTEATTAQRRELAREAEGHAQKIVELCGKSSEQAQYTARQFRRYFNWWGERRFARDLQAYGVPEKKWGGKYGILQTSKRIAVILAGPKVKEPGWRPMDVKIGPEGESGAEEAPEGEEDDEGDGGDRGGGEPGGGATSPTTRLGGAGDQPPPPTDDPDSELVIELVPAHNGDCLWIEYGPRQNRSRLIVDCGASSAARELDKRLARVRGEVGEDPLYDLFILTHIDSDHISGVLRFFETSRVAFHDIWFNGWPQLPKEHLDPRFLGVKQGEAYSKLLAKQKRPWNGKERFTKSDPPKPICIPEEGTLPTYELPGDMKLTLLSPGREELERLAEKWAEGRKELEPSERFLGGKRPQPVPDPSQLDLEQLAGERTDPDPSVANGSSIAVLAEYGGKSALLLGDAHAEVVAASIRRLQAERKRQGERLAVDAVKLSHHGSANALSADLLGLVDCRRYLVSTNGSRFYHPHREAIARVVMHGGDSPALYFNYGGKDNKYSQVWADEKLQEKYGFYAFFPEPGEPGQVVRL